MSISTKIIKKIHLSCLNNIIGARKQIFILIAAKYKSYDMRVFNFEPEIEVMLRTMGLNEYVSNAKGNILRKLEEF